MQFILPVRGTWFVAAGGTDAAHNHHLGDALLNYAVDLVKVDEVKLRHGSSHGLDCPCFGVPVYSPALGVVVEAVDGVNDNTPPFTHTYSNFGNYVMIRHRRDLFSLLAHLKRGSVTVGQGSTVRAGEELGLCGNSGLSSEPHLHFHVQNAQEVGRYRQGLREPVARGLPLQFGRTLVRREAAWTRETTYKPSYGDTVRL